MEWVPWAVSGLIGGLLTRMLLGETTVGAGITQEELLFHSGLALWGDWWVDWGCLLVLVDRPQLAMLDLVLQFHKRHVDGSIRPNY